MAVAASREGGVLLSVDRSETKALLDKPHTRPMVMRGRELEGWLRVDPDGLRTKRQLTTWVAVSTTLSDTEVASTWLRSRRVRPNTVAEAGQVGVPLEPVGAAGERARRRGRALRREVPDGDAVPAATMAAKRGNRSMSAMLAVATVWLVSAEAFGLGVSSATRTPYR